MWDFPLGCTGSADEPARIVSLPPPTPSRLLSDTGGVKPPFGARRGVDGRLVHGRVPDYAPPTRTPSLREGASGDVLLPRVTTRALRGTTPPRPR